jgi:cytoskeleton protein RodZ
MNKEKIIQKDFLGLRTKREASGLTLKDLFNTTRVSEVNLEAIENGDFHELPVPVYTKNFIKTYARALNIDSKPILESYEGYLNSLQIAPTRPPEAETGDGHYGKMIGRYKTYIWAAAIIIVIAVAALIISLQYQPLPEVTDDRAKSTKAVPQAPVAVTLANPVASTGKQAPPPVLVPAAQRADKPIPTAPALTEQKNAAVLKPITPQNAPEVEKRQTAPIDDESGLLIIKSTEETWLRMKIDEKQPFQVLLKPGEVIEREGAGFDIDIGNAGGIKIQYRGKIIENLGKSGQVIHLRLP